MMKKLLLSCLFLVAFSAFSQKKSSKEEYKVLTVKSPDEKLVINITLGKNITYNLFYSGKEILKNSPISMTLYDGRELGRNSTYRSDFTLRQERYIRPLYHSQNSISEKSNELTINFKEDFSLIFRAFNEGMAYRFATKISGGLLIKNEEATFNFSDNYKAYFHADKLESSFESDYEYKNISQGRGLFSMPFLVELPEGKRAAILESDLLDYPGMHLKIDTAQNNRISGFFAQYPKSWKLGGHSNFNLNVIERNDFIAQTNGTRTFSWRIVAIANSDKELLSNQLVYILASDNKLEDVNWIKPGKVSWDWWNAMNLTGVPFKTGVNTQTYKYYIDFAAANNLEYVILDEGWSDPQDLLKLRENVNMDELTAYAKQKKVGLILWCVWHTLDRQMKEAMEQFEHWGIAGLKIDFMDRDDQIVVNFYENTLKEAAKHHLLVDFHGAFKPTGLEKTYPNNITREAVKGLEYDKFSAQGISPEHDVTLPFIRNMAGAMDFTPGAMTNRNKANWRMVSDQPESQGTRCHQMAMYTVYYSPLMMLADSPTAYQREQECTNFIAKVPTIWDETVPLNCRIGDFITMARRKNDVWYLGAMTDWDARNYQVKLDFLGEGTYDAEIFSDGINAERVGNDYKKEIKRVTKNDFITIDMASGGGYTARFSPVR